MRVCFILLSSSPSPPPFYRPPPLSLFLVFLTFPTLVVPVHSIRLEYGCVVVDTCSVWSVGQCCVMICCSSWCHQTRSSDWISGDKRWKGWPRFPKKNKDIGSHLNPTHSWKNISGTFPLCTVSLWDLAQNMKTHGLYCMYFLWWYLVML